MGAERVLVLAVSARSLSESAARAGYATRAVDAFGDRDQLQHTPTIALSRERGVAWSARAAAVAAREIACDMIVYGSGFEHYPRVVGALSTIAPVVGNTPETLRRARDPIELARVLGARGFCVPAVSETLPPPTRGTRALARRRWLRKPRDSGGGIRVSNWRAGVPLAERMVLQERIPGKPMSIVFAADGQRALPLALSTQLIGDPNFGAGGYRYCGNILEANRGEVYEGAVALARAATEEFNLVGLNGIDFIDRDGVPWPLEINPRYTASVELVERATGNSMFELHLRGCRGELPARLSEVTPTGRPIEGKAVLYARRTMTIGETEHWLDDPDVRDVPHPYETFPRGRPICTIFARARTVEACRAALVERATVLYAEMEAGDRSDA